MFLLSECDAVRIYSEWRRLQGFDCFCFSRNKLNEFLREKLLLELIQNSKVSFWQNIYIFALPDKNDFFL